MKFVDQFKAVGFIFMLIGGFLELSEPIAYAFKGMYFAIPIDNFILALLSLIGCFIVWRGYLLAGGLLGLIVGSFIHGAGEYFTYRDTAGWYVFLGGAISIIIWLIMIARQVMLKKTPTTNP
jgi:hypothetical protein